VDIFKLLSAGYYMLLSFPMQENNKILLQFTTAEVTDISLDYVRFFSSFTAQLLATLP
jgi:hypothetical protein